VIDLDDTAALSAGDPSDMLGAVTRAPRQWREGIERAEAVQGLPSVDGVRAVVACGMGGSGIAGDVLAAVAAARMRVPVAVVKGYTLPAYIGPETLVLAISYSGNTEETLSCFEQAQEKKARIIAISTGGKVAERAAAAKIPHVRPVEGLQPRAALYSLAVIPLVLLGRMGLLDAAPELDAVERLLEEQVGALEAGVPAEKNEAKRLAHQLDGYLPLVWGQEGELAVAALRWRCQFNENAKMPAFDRVLPELDHNELAGYDPGLPELGRVALIVLRTDGEHPRIAKRVDASLGVMRDRVGLAEQGWALGGSPLERLMSVALLGDFVSVYLALLRGVDPTPVDVIERLKRALG
jgi:glucose/mannose-6-phosphate isomerase